MKKIKPLRDRIIVERIEESEKTAGGIYIPDSAKEKPQRGRVLSVGDGRTLDNGQHVKPVVKAGDEVLFGKYSGTEVAVDGSEYLIMREDDILGIVE